MISARSDNSHGQVQVYNRFWRLTVSEELPLMTKRQVKCTVNRSWTEIAWSLALLTAHVHFTIMTGAHPTVI